METKIYESRMYGVALKHNYNDRCKFITQEEALEFIHKTGKPENYILTRTIDTIIFDKEGVFYGSKSQTNRISFTFYEVWKSDEIGHDFHEKTFYDMSAADDYLNTMERYDKGWHFRCITKTY